MPATNPTPPECPNCEMPGKLVDDAVVYGTSRGGRVWVCQTGCDTRVGAHPDGRPLGTMAGPGLRRARIRAHTAFDGWRDAHGLTRRNAYKALASLFDVPEAHIGEMTENECEIVYAYFYMSPERVARARRGRER